MIYGSVCSGIEAASVAWEPLGFVPAWFSEIEKFPSAVLANHWPQVPNLGDMTRLACQIRSGLIPAPDLLVGGTPCQAFSVAGLRAGLDDPRGQLTLAYVDLLNAIDEKRTADGKPAAICVWENVPGVLNTRDNAFGCFLAGLAGESRELESPGRKWSNAGYVLGPKRAITWRVLDAQFFGVAQQRKRVFIVASARADFDTAKILFEHTFGQRSSPENKVGGRRCTTAIDGSTLFRFRRTDNYACDGLSSTLSARDYKERRDLVVAGNGKVRVLTPLEYERLQGFPDNHTLIQYPIKLSEDAQRYKALGNSMAVPVMRWIGQRIKNQIQGLIA
ncbi:DNA cytosine methyltransferase [Pantoea ananatis]|uniref:DNA cytosine methyltransferase n=1 Tax=Pantoea ananas TaxID=553 RepID=UPI000FEC3D40|nr:DNA cytosine methyltransferase [Pantoea ananatis]QAB30917.1 DNA cytosine methyltransferase [Pantoea ananatis]